MKWVEFLMYDHEGGAKGPINSSPQVVKFKQLGLHCLRL